MLNIKNNKNGIIDKNNKRNIFEELITMLQSLKVLFESEEENINIRKNEEFYLYRDGDSSSYSISELHQRKVIIEVQKGNTIY